MNIHKKTILFFSILFLLSAIICLIFENNNISATVSNIFIAIFTSTFIVICTSFVNYFHEKEVFFNNLFFYGIFVFANIECLKIFSEKTNQHKDIAAIYQMINLYYDAIENIAKNINFAAYSPIFTKSNEAKSVACIYHLFFKITNNIKQIVNDIKILKIQKEIADLNLQKLKISESNNILDETKQTTSEFEEEIQNIYISFNSKIIQLFEELKDINNKYKASLIELHSYTKNKTKLVETISISEEDAIKTIENLVKYIN